MPSAHSGWSVNMANVDDGADIEGVDISGPDIRVEYVDDVDLDAVDLAASNHDLAGAAMNPASRRTTAGSSPARPPSRHAAASATPSPGSSTRTNHTHVTHVLFAPVSSLKKPWLD